MKEVSSGHTVIWDHRRENWAAERICVLKLRDSCRIGKKALEIPAVTQMPHWVNDTDLSWFLLLERGQDKINSYFCDFNKSTETSLCSANTNILTNNTFFFYLINLTTSEHGIHVSVWASLYSGKYLKMHKSPFFSQEVSEIKSLNHEPACLS